MNKKYSPLYYDEYLSPWSKLKPPRQSGYIDPITISMNRYE